MSYPDNRAKFSLDDLPPFLTEEEVAEYLRLPLKTLVRMRYDKRGPRFRRCGNDHRYPLGGLLEWLSAKEA